ncbi:hypothetical protein KH172YL63_04540 [Bacillus sp. KH172YL63]|nr:hypothetical protein KH172YL63_04540 [Bacillus sp. KH172YL63]
MGDSLGKLLTGHWGNWMRGLRLSYAMEAESYAMNVKSHAITGESCAITSQTHAINVLSNTEE